MIQRVLGNIFFKVFRITAKLIKYFSCCSSCCVAICFIQFVILIVFFFSCLSFIVFLFFSRLFIFICQLSPLISDIYMIVNFLFIFFFIALPPPVFPFLCQYLLCLYFLFFSPSLIVEYSFCFSRACICKPFKEPSNSQPGGIDSGILKPNKYVLSCCSVNFPVAKFIVPEWVIKLTLA
jgi:hypothetical protein